MKQSILILAITYSVLFAVNSACICDNTDPIKACYSPTNNTIWNTRPWSEYNKVCCIN